MEAQGCCEGGVIYCDGPIVQVRPLLGECSRGDIDGEDLAGISSGAEFVNVEIRSAGVVVLPVVWSRLWVLGSISKTVS